MRSVKIGPTIIGSDPDRVVVESDWGSIIIWENPYGDEEHSDEEMEIIRKVIAKPFFVTVQFVGDEAANLVIAKWPNSDSVLIENGMGEFLTIDEVRRRISEKNAWLGLWMPPDS